MKKWMGGFLVLCFLLTCGCGREKEEVDISFEDGVEVVFNHQEPYKIKNCPDRLSLENELSIDFAGEDIAELGIADTMDFEVDSEGGIYFFYAHKEGDLVFKFDSAGHYSASFGRKGQGPGEIQYIVWTGIDSRDQIIVSDNGNRKILVFSKDGILAQEIRYPPKVGLLYSLENGNYFGLWDKHPAESGRDMYIWAFSLYGPGFEEIKLLDKQNVYDFNTQGMRGIISRPFTARQILRDSIFVACEDRGYEILKYDLEGNLVQIIRKEFSPVAVSAETKQERKKQYESFGEEVWFPDQWPPIGDFFLDDEKRIFVKTFEKGEKPDEFIFDIFTPEGAFFSRKALNILTNNDANICAMSGRGRLYCFQEKADGFREFKVFRMIWE